jgi:hypothetical protein
MVLTMENPLHNATIDDVDDNCDTTQICGELGEKTEKETNKD